MSVNATPAPLEPQLPSGMHLDLPGRGETFVRTVDGPPGAPTLLLLHGWTATADLNWFHCYEALGEHYRVVAVDHRGHGRGIRTRKPFRIEDCADDAMAVCDALEIPAVIPVGYSMGGPVALQTWRRHPERVHGLVLAATAPWFRTSRTENLAFLGLTGLAALARLTPSQVQQRLTDQFYLQHKTQGWEPWAAQELSRHDWRMILEAGHAVMKFSAREWLADIDVPTSVLITMRDTTVPTRRQVRLFEGIDGSEAFRVDGDHSAVASAPHRFVPTLLRAVHSVVERVPTNHRETRVPT